MITFEHYFWNSHLSTSRAKFIVRYNIITFDDNIRTNSVDVPDYFIRFRINMNIGNPNTILKIPNTYVHRPRSFYIVDLHLNQVYTSVDFDFLCDFFRLSQE